MPSNPDDRHNPQLPSEELSVETEADKEKPINSIEATENKLPKQPILFTKTIVSLGVLVVLIGGISIATNRLKPASVTEGMEDMKGMSMEDMMRVDGSFNPTPVTVESIKPSLLEASVRYTGSVRPYLELTVYPRVGGQLTEYSAYPGDKVKAGQMLARLSAVELSTEVEEAIAESEAAKAELQVTKAELDEQEQEIERMAAESTYLETRLKRTQRVLLDRGAITLNEFDQQKSEATAAKASLRAAQLKKERLKAQIARAEAQLAQSKVKIQRLKVIESYKTISSPIAGTIQERMVDPGVVVEPGMGILKIGDYSRVRLQANVD